MDSADPEPAPHLCRYYLHLLRYLSHGFILQETLVQPLPEGIAPLSGCRYSVRRTDPRICEHQPAPASFDHSGQLSRCPYIP